MQAAGTQIKEIPEMARYKHTDHSPMPQFAQPLNSVRYAGTLKARQTSFPSYAAAVLSIAAGGALLMLARPDVAQNRPTPAANTATHPAAPFIEPNAVDLKTNRRSLDYYTKGGVRSNLFSAPVPPAPKPVKVVVVPPPKIEVPKPIVVPVAIINPFAGWNYTGTVQLNGITMALLENKATHEGQYLKVGESLLGAQVTAITDNEVTLSSGGNPVKFARSTDYTVTPLDKSAGQAGGQPGQPNGQPGQPGGGGMTGQMGNVQMNFGDNVQPMVTLPNGRQMTVNQARRRNNRLNRNF